MKSFLLCIILTLALGNFLLSQDIQEPVIRRITTMEYMAALAIEDTTYHDNVKDIEDKNKKFEKRGNKKDYILAVVFHLVYTENMPSISKDQVLSQLDALNRDFNEIIEIENHPNDEDKEFDSRKDLASIQFCLPKSNGNQEIGIIEVQSNLDQWEDLNQVKSESDGGSDPWKTDKYINVWVTSLEEFNSGYAQMPGGTPETDGIVIDYRYFGQRGIAVFPYDEGKTLTHLVGNYLGLYPLWGEFECGDDYLEDTPVHNSPNYACPEFDHISTCEGNSTEMTMNFMDATYDACRYMFTKGQVTRMQSTLSNKGYRHKLTNTQTDCDPVFELESMTEEIITSRDFDQKKIKVSPNPVRDELYISFDKIDEQRNVDFTVYTLAGHLVHHGKLTGDVSNHTLNVKDWKPGLYIIMFRVDEDIILEKIIIQ